MSDVKNTGQPLSTASIASAATAGARMHALASRLFPLHRAQTGDGLRQTLRILAEEIPLEILERTSGSKVLDWHIPDEWRIRDAFIAASDGERVVDYGQSNLHVANGSVAVNATMTWEDLCPHLHSVADQPDSIPYRTSFFREQWGFCVTHAQRDRLRHGGPWKVVIDAEYFHGSLSLGECQLAGESEQTVLIHCHTCHPSLANDNLSGLVVATELAKYLQTMRRRYTYRLVFAPATIGPIAWLAGQTPSQLDQIRHGLVLTLLGDSAPLTYKLTRDGNEPIDCIVRQVLGRRPGESRTVPFDPSGYDERQFNSPGFALPVGRLSRSVHGEFPEYHTSADNLQFIQPRFLAESLQVLLEIVASIEASRYPVSRKPFGEPQLGPLGIFRAFGDRDDRGDFQTAMMWILNLADGRHSVTCVAQRSGFHPELIEQALAVLIEHGLIDLNDFSSRTWSPDTSAGIFC